MGYSGLIYAAIVAAWAAFLVPRWVRRNEEVEHAREIDQERRVRVLSRRSGPPQAPHGSVTLPPPSAATAVPARSAPAGPAPLGPVDDAFALAARRRRRMLAVLLLLFVGSLALVVLGRAPGWAPLGPGVLLALFLFLARRAAVVQARRRRVAARRAAVERRRAVPADATVTWATPAESVEENVGRRLVLPDELVAEAPAEDPNAWSPVSVPLPTYLTKPKATRPAARKIDLGQPGAWTSGRLDPASSIELPHRAPDERPAAPVEPSEAAEAADIVEERRRAVGD